MGMNYYINPPSACKCCGRDYDALHIGKASHGWKFLFRAYSTFEVDDLELEAADDEIASFEQWKEYLKDKEIVNENWASVSLEKFIELVEKKQNGLSHLTDSKTHGYRGNVLDGQGYEFFNREFS